MVSHQNAKNHEKSAGSLTSHWSLGVKFWGVRGTMPTPKATVLKYGGNTSCVQGISQKHDRNNSLILDAGSGIIEFGENALKEGIKEFHIMFSHMHSLRQCYLWELVEL